MSTDSELTIYYSSITSNPNISTQQRHIETVLTANNLAYKFIDIASDSSKKDEMRTKTNNPTALPPQIFNGDIYCGGYEEFQLSVEEERVKEFLHVS